MEDRPSFVLPSKVPWSALKGKELEECTYWLLDAMGARDLQWRVGGEGEGAADQGRDIEATFYSSDPDGEMRRQHWWVEAKGRNRTLEKEAVVNSAQNAATASNADVLLIVTNTRFSNPTVDWVSLWNAKNARPKVRLWDQPAMERHLCAHPQVIARFFPSALSPQGCVEYVSSQFWNYTHFGETGTLKLLWEKRQAIKWNHRAYVAVIMSEIANGDINRRAWGAVLSASDLYQTFVLALGNGPYVVIRAERFGTDLDGYIEALAYLLLNLLSHFEANHVAKLVESVWALTNQEKLPKEVTEFFVQPMLRRLEAELFDLCQDRCHRITTTPTLLSEKQIENYWDRLRENDEKAEGSEKENVLVIETKAVDCAVGFKSGCPYFGDEKKALAERLDVMRRTIAFRFKEDEKRSRDPLRKILR